MNKNLPNWYRSLRPLLEAVPVVNHPTVGSNVAPLWEYPRRDRFSGGDHWGEVIGYLITSEEHIEFFDHLIDRLESIRLIDHLTHIRSSLPTEGSKALLALADSNAVDIAQECFPVVSFPLVAARDLAAEDRFPFVCSEWESSRRRCVATIVHVSLPVPRWTSSSSLDNLFLMERILTLTYIS